MIRKTLDPQQDIFIKILRPTRSTIKPIMTIPVICMNAITIAASFGFIDEPVRKNMNAVYSIRTLLPENVRNAVRSNPIKIPKVASFVAV